MAKKSLRHLVEMSETAIQPKDDMWWHQARDAGCSVCYEIGSSFDDSFATTSYATIQYRIELMEQLQKHMKVCRKFWNRTKPRTGNGTYQGAWAFTLTMSPKDGLSVGDMLTAVRKVMKQKSNPVKSYAWYYEDKGRDDNGDPIHPHIHGMYETATGGRVEAKHFKRAWSIWDERKPIGAGFRGGYHRPVRSEERYDDYIKKDGGMGECLMDDNRTE